jgi:NADH:ubiquinone oxidoreductase subunit 5 (subunit L)/multisubunit Na+/H+ antiporter MnhA subunit
MEGPTPVSAMIHAATLVLAGLIWISKFVLVIFIPWFIITFGVMGIISYALFSLVTYDVKRVIAFSTAYHAGSLIIMAFWAIELVWHHFGVHAVFKCIMFLVVAGILHMSMHTDVRALPEIVLFGVKFVLIAVVVYHSVAWYWTACEFTKKCVTLMCASGFVSTYCSAKLLLVGLGILMVYTYVVQILCVGLAMCMGCMSECSHIQSMSFTGSLLLLCVCPSSDLVLLVMGSGGVPPPDRDVVWLFLYFLGALVLGLGYTYILSTLLNLRAAVQLLVGRSSRSSRSYDSSSTRFIYGGLLSLMAINVLYVLSEGYSSWGWGLGGVGGSGAAVWARASSSPGVIAGLVLGQATAVTC